MTNYREWAGQHSRYSDWLRAGWSGDRILVGGEIWFFLGVEAAGGEGDSPSSAEVLERIELYLYSP